MSKEQGNVRWLQLLVLVLSGMAISISSWTVLKAVELDKELSTLKATNMVEHTVFQKSDDTINREQRMMSQKIDKTYTKVIQIAAKLNINTP